MISLKIIVKDVIFKGKNISIVCRLKVIYFPLTKSKFFFSKTKICLFSKFLVLIWNITSRWRCTFSDCDTAQSNVAVSKSRAFYFFAFPKLNRIKFKVGMKFNPFSLFQIEHSNFLKQRTQRPFSVIFWA